MASASWMPSRVRMLHPYLVSVAWTAGTFSVRWEMWMPKMVCFIEVSLLV